MKRQPPAPAGLRLAFAWLREDGHTATFASNTAAESVLFARRLLTEYRKHGDAGAIAKLLDEAADHMFPDWDTPARENPELTQKAALYVGFAACWLLMMTVNGKELGR